MPAQVAVRYTSRCAAVRRSDAARRCPPERRSAALSAGSAALPLPLQAGETDSAHRPGVLTHWVGAAGLQGARGGVAAHRCAWDHGEGARPPLLAFRLPSAPVGSCERKRRRVQRRVSDRHPPELKPTSEQSSGLGGCCCGPEASGGLSAAAFRSVSLCSTDDAGAFQPGPGETASFRPDLR